MRFAIWTGSEFLVLMPGASLDTARPAAERLREQLTAHSAQFQGTSVKISVSIGIAQWTDHAEELSRLLIRADTALYQAKAQGRDRVFASDSDSKVGKSSGGSAA